MCNSRLYSISKFAELAGTSSKTVYRKVASGLIPSVRMAGQVRIPSWFLSDLVKRPGEIPESPSRLQVGRNEAQK